MSPYPHPPSKSPMRAARFKENLVAQVEEWPGVHSAHALLTGKPLEGNWYDRTLGPIGT